MRMIRIWIDPEKLSILKRLEMIKDLDQDYKQILNDSYNHIKKLSDRLDLLEDHLYELAGTEQKL